MVVFDVGTPTSYHCCKALKGACCLLQCCQTISSTTSFHSRPCSNVRFVKVHSVALSFSDRLLNSNVRTYLCPRNFQQPVYLARFACFHASNACSKQVREQSARYAFNCRHFGFSALSRQRSFRLCLENTVLPARMLPLPQLKCPAHPDNCLTSSTEQTTMSSGAVLPHRQLVHQSGRCNADAALE
jgi:hypothetical protein